MKREGKSVDLRPAACERNLKQPNLTIDSLPFPLPLLYSMLKMQIETPDTAIHLCVQMYICQLGKRRKMEICLCRVKKGVCQ